jgi:lipopolysaccharide/colanic/teichoic acid biosynthesis glycosyltransferase
MFDVIVASILLALLWPVLLLVAVAVRLSSPGPAFFRQTRVGQQGRQFHLLKFRSMRVSAERCGPGVTRQGDPRILPFGRVLRQWKLDELPQLFNVLCGDMSLVGPRPDLPEFCVTLDKTQHHILELRPGVTGTATLAYRNEEALLREVGADRIENYYAGKIYPEKVRLDLEYATKASFAGDLKILIKTMAAVFS